MIRIADRNEDDTTPITFVIKQNDGTAVDVSSLATATFRVAAMDLSGTALIDLSWGGGIAYPSGGDGTDGKVEVTLTTGLVTAGTMENRKPYRWQFRITHANLGGVRTFDGVLSLYRTIAA